MYIGIDFDGTCVKHKYPYIGEDIGATRVLKKIVEAGHDLILHTMRCDIDLDRAEEWFRLREIPLFAVNHNPTQKSWTSSPKPYCHIYIDDAALGAPLTIPDQGRPYINWDKVEVLLIEKQIL